MLRIVSGMKRGLCSGCAAAAAVSCTPSFWSPSTTPLLCAAAAAAAGTPLQKSVRTSGGGSGLILLLLLLVVWAVYRTYHQSEMKHASPLSLPLSISVSFPPFMQSVCSGGGGGVRCTDGQTDIFQTEKQQQKGMNPCQRRARLSVVV